MYKTNKLVLFFVRGSIKYMFWIVCVSKLSVHMLPTITQDNRDYTVLRFESIRRHRLQRQLSVRAVHTYIYIYIHSNLHI